DHNENLLAQESISERIQHITLRAQQLDDLMFPSAAPSAAATAKTSTLTSSEVQYARVDADQEVSSAF
ncbi:hypothetical protein SK128_020583, partial [Halocaridina rubra]